MHRSKADAAEQEQAQPFVLLPCAGGPRPTLPVSGRGAPHAHDHINHRSRIQGELHVPTIRIPRTAAAARCSPSGRRAAGPRPTAGACQGHDAERQEDRRQRAAKVFVSDRMREQDSRMGRDQPFEQGKSDVRGTKASAHCSLMKPSSASSAAGWTGSRAPWHWRRWHVIRQPPIPAAHLGPPDHDAEYQDAHGGGGEEGGQGKADGERTASTKAHQPARLAGLRSHSTTSAITASDTAGPMP